MQKEQRICLYIILSFSFVMFLIYLVLVSTKNQGLIAFDQSIANYFYSHRIRFFDYLFVIISYFGETFSIVSFCALLLILPNRKNVGVPVTIITFVSMLLNLVIKYAVVRLRPQGLFLAEPTLFYNMPDGYSFPSGHAQQGVVFIMSLAILSGLQTKKIWKQTIILTSGIVLSILTCLSRVYLCVHFLSDVLCGLSLAILLLSVGYLIKEHFAPKHTFTIYSETAISKNKWFLNTIYIANFFCFCALNNYE